MFYKTRQTVLFLQTLLFLGLVLMSASCVVDRLGGAFQYDPETINQGLSAEAQKLIQDAFVGIDPDNLRDFHTHVLGLGTKNTGAYVNPKMRRWWSLRSYARFQVYASASGVQNLDNADEEYMQRLVRLIRAIPNHGKYHLLAFDQFHTLDGTPDPTQTTFYIPNDYIFRLAETYPNLFIPTISVHPYRSDALEELERWAKRGAKYVKWLPNAMGIDPSHEKTHAFYDMMRKYDMVLLSHTGEEQAVDAEEHQHYGNPLRLRTPLERGVKVIMAHCASRGTDIDLDDPQKKEVRSFDLAIRLMEESAYEEQLFCEISVLIQFNRFDPYLSELLKRQDLHSRLINGSDYPLPAVNVIIHLGKLVNAGLITPQQETRLKEIYQYNPLLFDFVVKRTVRLPGTSVQFPASVFMKPDSLP